MAYRLDSQRIFDAEPATEAVPAHSSPQLPSRSFGFHNSQSPSKPVAAAVLHHAAPSISAPAAVAVRSAASPTELSGTSSVCPASLFPGSGSPPRPSKRVGIFPHDAHADWDFLKSGATSHPARLTATEPGLILSTLQRGLAHVPERRPLTEAEVNCCGIPSCVSACFRQCRRADRRSCVKRNSPQNECSCQARTHASIHGSKSGALPRLCTR